MNQEIQPLFEVDAMKVAVGSTPDPEVAERVARVWRHWVARREPQRI